MDLQATLAAIFQDNPLTQELKKQTSNLPHLQRKIYMRRKDHIYHCVRYLANHCKFSPQSAVSETLKHCDWDNVDFQLDFEAIAGRSKSKQS